jgi:hypothetical protein
MNTCKDCTRWTKEQDHYPELHFCSYELGSRRFYTLADMSCPRFTNKPSMPKHILEWKPNWQTKTPTNNWPVLVWLGDGDFEVAYFEFSRGWYNSSDDELFPYNVLCWTYIPVLL